VDQKEAGPIDEAALKASTEAVKIVRALKRTFPKGYVKPIIGIISALVVVPVLILFVTLLLLPVLIWDLFDPFGVGVHWVVYLFYLFLYACAGYLSYILISDVLDIVDVIYHPVKHLIKRTASTLMRPITKTLKKALVFLMIALGVIELIIALIMVVFGFSFALLIAMIVLALVFVTMVLIGKAITMTVRRVLDLLFRSAFGFVDRSFGISDKAKRYGERIDREIESEKDRRSNVDGP